MHCLYLLHYIGEVSVSEVLHIQCVKRLRHIDAVEPHLIGINGFVPEISLPGSGLCFDLLHKTVCSKAVLLCSRLFIKLKQHSSLIDIVKICFLGFQSQNVAVFLHKMIDDLFRESSISLISRDGSHFHKCRQHAAVNIVPFHLLAFPDLLQIPGGALRRGLLYQAQHIGIDSAVICHS